MKKSIVISARNVLKKVVSVTAAGAVLFTALYFEVPNKFLSNMADNVMKKNETKNFLEEVFSFSPEKNVFLSISYKPAIVAAAPQPEKKEEINEEELQHEEQPTPGTADLSESKSGSSVSFGDITVSNIAGKSFNIEELLKKPLNFNKKSGGYKVLIVHSHTTESYFPNERTNDEAKNVVRVGNEFEKILTDNGIKTLHIKKVHDAPYSLSYKNSLESVTVALNENPTIEVVIDIHRDSINDKNNRKLKPIATINGENTAQVMIVTGTNAGGLPHDNWSENLAFSLKIQKIMNEKFKNLARPVNLSKERYNTHTTKSSIIFEIGADGNTIEEAILGAKYSAAAVSELLK